jgi:hypothetical protein
MWEDNIKMDLRDMGRENRRSVVLAENLVLFFEYSDSSARGVVIFLVNMLFNVYIS